MPAFVKTPADEKKWKRAKDAAVTSLRLKKRPGSNKWALANYIFHRMKKSSDAGDFFGVFSIDIAGVRKLHQIYNDEAEADQHAEGLKKLYKGQIETMVKPVQGRFDMLKMSVQRAKDVMKARRERD